MSTINKPLDGITVLEFSQFLSGPAAGLRLSDLGAKVIKIERPGSHPTNEKLTPGNSDQARGDGAWESRESELQ